MRRGVEEDASNHMALNRGSQTSNETKWGKFLHSLHSYHGKGLRLLQLDVLFSRKRFASCLSNLEALLEMQEVLCVSMGYSDHLKLKKII